MYQNDDIGCMTYNTGLSHSEEYVTTSGLDDF
jgi:hypothetical protein